MNQNKNRPNLTKPNWSPALNTVKFELFFLQDLFLDVLDFCVPSSFGIIVDVCCGSSFAIILFSTAILNVYFLFVLLKNVGFYSSFGAVESLVMAVLLV